MLVLQKKIQKKDFLLYTVVFIYIFYDILFYRLSSSPRSLDVRKSPNPTTQMPHQNFGASRPPIVLPSRQHSHNRLTPTIKSTSYQNVAMPSIPIHVASPSAVHSHTENPLPQLLHTPSGLGLLEIQGTVHFPASSAQSSTQIGKLVFPYYNPDINDPSDTKWMKRVYMYVGKGQRMTGECKKLAKPIAIIRKKEKEASEDVDMGGIVAENEDEASKDEELEIVEVVKYRIVFSARPEPISGVAEAS